MLNNGKTSTSDLPPVADSTGSSRTSSREWWHHLDEITIAAVVSFEDLPDVRRESLRQGEETKTSIGPFCPNASDLEITRMQDAMLADLGIRGPAVWVAYWGTPADGQRIRVVGVPHAEGGLAALYAQIRADAGFKNKNAGLEAASTQQVRSAEREQVGAQNSARANDEAQTLAHEKKARTKAPKPPTEMGGRGVAYSPKPLRMPSRPDDFPGDLWPRAVVILAKAVERFRDENHLTELCEHVVEKMTPLYCEAVETGKVKAHAVLDDRSGMAELLRLLLIANDPGISSWGLSNRAWDILQKVKTATWMKLAEAIAEAQENNSNEADRLRTNPNEAESSSAQNSEKTTQSMEGCDAAASQFTHSPDYRSVTIRSETFSLTSQQAHMIQILHEAYKWGTPDLGNDYILVQLAGDNRGENSRWQDTWKSNPKAKKALIKSGASKGTLRLKF
ncbi:MAG TPA: hypothetical protein VGR97_11875 [Candidatus Acidoferrales bacterium]|nr:hypothetical protein [Candidatus Acidoferrales bacterium]